MYINNLHQMALRGLDAASLKILQKFRIASRAALLCLSLAGFAPLAVCLAREEWDEDSDIERDRKTRMRFMRIDAGLANGCAISARWSDRRCGIFLKDSMRAYGRWRLGGVRIVGPIHGRIPLLAACIR